MILIALGLNHRSAPLDVLERMSMSADLVPKALAELTAGDHVNEAVLISTCNRIEVYAHVERFHDGFEQIRDALSVVTGVDNADFADHLYVHSHDEAVCHLFSVSSGLDSAVLGEHEILGQVRTAWETARIEGAASVLLEPLFDHAIKCGKRVRTDTAIGRRTASISHAAVSLVAERVGTLDAKRVLLVGAGEVGAGVANALGRTSDIDLIVTNRTASKADDLAASLGGRTVPFGHFESQLADVDIVISATGAPGVVISAESVQAAMEHRSDRLLILDLAVPRDVDAAVLGYSNVGLLVLSDLQAFANRGLEERQREAVAARRLVDLEIERFRDTNSAREISPLLGSMYRWADAVRIDEIERHATKLSSLDPESREAVEALTKALVSKLLHEPSSHLRDAAGSARGERLADALRELFDLT